MLDYKNIALGFYNNTKRQFGLEDKITEELAIKRYEICLQCPTISESKLRCRPKSEGGCNCVLAYKTRSNSNCPQSKW